MSNFYTIATDDHEIDIDQIRLAHSISPYQDVRITDSKGNTRILQRAVMDVCCVKCFKPFWKPAADSEMLCGFCKSK